MTETTPPVHLKLRGKIDEATVRFANRAALTAAHLFGVTIGTHLRHLRNLGDPLASLQAQLQEAELKARLGWQAAELLAARLAKIPERQRPYYTPTQRFQILQIKNLLAWSGEQAARVFLLCSNTIVNWERAADPNVTSIGSLVKPVPPIRRAADVVRFLVQLMASHGFGGPDLTARILARAGWRVSARSVERYRKEPLVAPPAAPEETQPQRPSRPVVTRFVHHVWMLDVTVVKSFLGNEEFHVAGVYDAHSRVPLSIEAFDRKPGAKDMALLLRRTARAFVPPRYVITDLGGEFTGAAFSKAVKRLGAIQRFASADSIRATARLERFWKTLKESAGLYGAALPLTIEDLEQRLELAFFHYVCLRPHEGLKGATPAEAFLGLEAACLKAVEPPRGGPGERNTEPPFVIEHLDPRSHSFPSLKPKA